MTSGFAEEAVTGSGCHRRREVDRFVEGAYRDIDSSEQSVAGGNTRRSVVVACGDAQRTDVAAVPQPG